MGQLKSQNNEQITPLIAQSDSTNIITMFKSLGSTGSTLTVDTRKAKMKTAFLVKINGQNQKDLSLGLDLPKFVEPLFSHLQNGVEHFYLLQSSF